MRTLFTFQRCTFFLFLMSCMLNVGLAQQTATYNPVFESTDQSLFEMNGGTPDGVNFNKQFLLNEDLSVFPDLSLEGIFFAKAGVAFNTYFKINELNGGQVDITYPIDITIKYPNDNTFGCNDWLDITTTCAIGDGYNLAVTPPTFDFELGTKLLSGFSAGIGPLVTSAPPGFEDATSSNWKSLADGFEEPFFQLNTNDGITWPWTFLGIAPPSGQIPSTFPIEIPTAISDVFNIGGSIDNPFSEDALDVVSGKTLRDQAAKQFLNLEFRPLNFQEYLTGVPLSVSIDAGIANASFTVLDIPLGIQIQQQRTVEFMGEVTIQFELSQSMEFEEREAGTDALVNSGTASTVTIKAGNKLRVKYPDGPPQITTVTPKFILVDDQISTLINEDVTFSVGLEVLKGELNIAGIDQEICEPNIWPFNLDGIQCLDIVIDPIEIPFAAIDEDFPIPTPPVEIPIYDETFDLPDNSFEEIMGNPFSLKPDQNPPVATYNSIPSIVNLSGTSINRNLSNFLLSYFDNEGGGVQFINIPTTTYTCDDVGPALYTWEGADYRCNTKIYEHALDVRDVGQPVVNTKSFDLYLDANGMATLLPENIDDNSTDNCGIDAYALSKENFSCDDVGDNSVILTVFDLYENSASAGATVTVIDNVPPQANCKNITVYLDDNGQVSIEAADVDNVSTDACGVATLAASPTSFDCSNTGDNVVLLTVTDVHDNENTCTAIVRVVDNIIPTITLCQGNTIDFNGEEQFLSSNYIDFEATDICGIASVSYDPEYITCEQLGMTVPVTVTVTDNNGNPNSCVANIEVTGLPCGWMDFGDNGIGCEDSNDFSYDVPTETFSLLSEGCYSSNWAADDAAYGKYELCGNGEIIAHVAGINSVGQGWAGITMRETEAPGSKKVAVATNFTNFVRREVRTATNGYAIPQQFFRPSATWLKITRMGNQFIGYASMDGQNWQLVLYATVDMPSCIQLGLYLTNYNSSVVTAEFDHVQITEAGGLSLSTPEINTITPTATPDAEIDFTIFPNPTREQIFIDLLPYHGQKVQIEILNQLGQPVIKRSVEEVGGAPEYFEVSDLSSGTYFIRVSTDQGDKTKRFSVLK